MRVHEFAKQLSEETGKAITTNQVLLLLSKKREGLRTMSNLDDELMEYARMRLAGSGKKADDKKSPSKKPQETMVRKAGPVKRTPAKKDTKQQGTAKRDRRDGRTGQESLSLKAKAELLKAREAELAAEAEKKPKFRPVVGAILSPSGKMSDVTPKDEEKAAETAAAVIEAEVKVNDVQAEAKTDNNAEVKAEVKAESKTEVKTEVKSEVKTEVKNEVKDEVKTAPQTSETKTDKQEEKPVEKPVEKAAEKSEEKAAEKAAEKTAEKPVEKTNDKQAEKATEKTSAKPVEKAHQAKHEGEKKQKFEGRQDAKQDRKDSRPDKRDSRPDKKDKTRDNAEPPKADRSGKPGADRRDSRSRKDKTDKFDKHDSAEMMDKPRKQDKNRKDKQDRDKFNKFDRDFDGDVKQRPKKKKDDSKNKKAAPAPVEEKPKQEEETIKTIVIPDSLTLKELADKIKTPVNAMIKKLFLEGKMLTVNTELSFDDAADIALEYNVICEQEEKVDIVEEMLKDIEDSEDSLTPRPPIVCVMGHVDHGKTSLLDAIRQTSVTQGEAGGITQHIGAYTVNVNDQSITFLDTPGHEAFTAMRMRGAQATDIAILVVAADDGVMPQTVEAINHAKAAGIEIIVAVNKIDKPSANIERVKQELVEHELIAEDWGGTTIFCPVSAHTKEGIDNLLDMILLTADVLELKANKNRKARGVVIEASLDKGRGPVASLLVQKGTLHVGDFLSIGEVHGKVRAMIDDKQRRVKEATPSTPVEIIGLNGVPNSGDIFISTETEKEAKQISEAFITRGKENLIAETKKGMSLDDLFTKMQEGTLKELDIIIKADVQGSVEAVKQSLLKLSNEEIVIKCIHSGVGAVNESDVTLASASDAIIIAFNTKVEPMARTLADQEKVDLRQYRVIYNAIDDIESAMKGMLDPVYEERITGHAEIRQIFKASGIGNIAGSYVLDGVIERNSSARITRDGDLVFEGKIASVKRFKDDVKEVKAGFECGLVFDGFNEIREGDQIEAYKMVEVPR